MTKKLEALMAHISAAFREVEKISDFPSTVRWLEEVCETEVKYNFLFLDDVGELRREWFHRFLETEGFDQASAERLILAYGPAWRMDLLKFVLEVYLQHQAGFMSSEHRWRSFCLRAWSVLRDRRQRGSV